MAIFIKNMGDSGLIPCIFLLQIKISYTHSEALIAFTESLTCATKFPPVLKCTSDNFLCDSLIANNIDDAKVGCTDCV